MHCIGLSYVDMPNRWMANKLRSQLWRVISGHRDVVQDTRRDPCLKSISDYLLRESSIYHTSCMISTTISWEIGLYSDDFKTTVFPQMRGIQIALKDKVAGAFQGAIANL